MKQPKKRVHANQGGSLPHPEPASEAKDMGPGYVYGCTGRQVTATQAQHVEAWLHALA